MQKLILIVLIVILSVSCTLPSFVSLSVPTTGVSTIKPGWTATPPSTASSPSATLPAQTSMPSQVQACTGKGQTVVLLVDPALYSGIYGGLTQFEQDICANGYIVIQVRADFATPPDVRDYLAKLFASTNKGLIGAILIGNIPYAYQWVTLKSTNPNIPSSAEEVVSFQYYSDLNGTFAASSGYHSPAGHPYSYDVHSGDVASEIWIGVLPDVVNRADLTIPALNRYFAKNHQYRTGQYNLPRAFLMISEFFKASNESEYQTILDELRSGEYAWTPFSNAANARIYFDAKFKNLTATQGYADLTAGVADFTVLDAHGDWESDGRLSISDVDHKPIKTVFFWSNGCAVGNLDYSDNFLASILYSPYSMVLVAKGTTNDSGGLGTNQNGFFGHNIATSLSKGESFGQAMLDHINVPLIAPWSEDREFQIGSSIIMGDPTLKLRP